jgi:hypothetical protein
MLLQRIQPSEAISCPLISLSKDDERYQKAY